jgi:TorA maturation chaperone TorD
MRPDGLVVAEEDLLRAHMYDFLSSMLARPPCAELLSKAAGLEGGDSALGRAVQSVARVASSIDSHDAELEFNALFIGLGRGELLPFASYYMTGFLTDRPLARLRDDMNHLNFTRAPNIYEPEDTIATIMEIMASLITGRLGDPARIPEQRAFFEAHLNPWADAFFQDLEAAKNSVLYAPIGSVGLVFMEIERESFRMAAEFEGAA